jgi:hypothetical protein
VNLNEMEKVMMKLVKVVVAVKSSNFALGTFIKPGMRYDKV